MLEPLTQLLRIGSKSESKKRGVDPPAPQPSQEVAPNVDDSDAGGGMVSRGDSRVARGSTHAREGRIAELLSNTASEQPPTPRVAEDTPEECERLVRKVSVLEEALAIAEKSETRHGSTASEAEESQAAMRSQVEALEVQVGVLRKENSRLRRMQGRNVGHLSLPELEELQSELRQGLSRVEAAIEQSRTSSVVDVCEDFLDPIMHTVMEDPVRLLTSGKVMDRAVIQHILSTEGGRDPFNRAELTLDMLEDVPDLRSKIQAWKAEHPESGGR